MNERLMQAETLRKAFDGNFAKIADVAIETQAEFLAIHCGPDAYAVSLADIGGLFADRSPVKIPSRHTALLGIVNIRGTIVPVYDLPALLSISSSGARRFFVLASSAPIAFAFDAFDGYFRTPYHDVLPRQSTDGEQHIRAQVRAENMFRSVIDLKSLIDGIGKRGT